MPDHFKLPTPWWQVGLTVLPGLFILLSAAQLMFGTLIGLGLASLWLAFKQRDLFDLPVWGLIPLGWVAFLIIAYIPYNLGSYGIYLLLILISLPFSRKSGLSAGLFILLGGSFAANFEVEPSIYFWDIPFWRVVINEGGWVLSMIVTPILVLRSRNVFGQALGQLLPLAAYVATFVYALSRISHSHPERFNFSLSNAISKSEPYIAQFVMLALALLAYAWIASRSQSEKKIYQSPISLTNSSAAQAEMSYGSNRENEDMQTANTTPRKTHVTKLIGSIVILGLVVLGPFLFCGWLVMTDSSGTFHNVTNVADLDGDGDLDVVMHNVRKESEFTAFSVLTLWFNQGDGQFRAQRLGDEHFGVGNVPGWASAAADVDLDGNTDLVVFPGWQVSLLYNQGGQSGEFGRARAVNNLGVDGQFGSIAMGDLNNDGRVDGVIAGCCGRQFTIDPERNVPNVSWTWINTLDGNGNPWFKTSPIPVLEGLAMRDIALGDLNGDTYPDLFAVVLVSEHGQNTDPYDRIFYNDGDGNFSDSGQRLGGSDSTAVALGDLDGDGDLDALVGTETQALMWVNQGSYEGTFTLAGQTLPGNKIKDVFLSDFDIDGDLDALVSGIREATIWWNNGQGGFTRSNQRFRYTKRHGAAVGDFNGDNRPDIFIAEYYKTYTLWLNQGDGIFRAEP